MNLYKSFTYILIVVFFATSSVIPIQLSIADDQYGYDEEDDQQQIDPQLLWDNRYGNGAWNELPTDKRIEFIKKLKSNQNRIRGKSTISSILRK